MKNKIESLGTQEETRSGGGGGEGGRMNQATTVSERETKRDQMAADVNQQLTWGQFRDLGLVKLLLVNTNNINLLPKDYREFLKSAPLT